jgi:hypothetical protein
LKEETINYYFEGTRVKLFFFAQPSYKGNPQTEVVIKLCPLANG